MMKDVFIVIPLLPDKHMRNESTKMLAELDQIENFHLPRSFAQVGRIFYDIEARTRSSQPSWEERSILYQSNRHNRTYYIVQK